MEASSSAPVETSSKYEGDTGLTDIELSEAFDALCDDPDYEPEGKGKGKEKAHKYTDEIIPTEREAWSAWPTALDEWRVEEAISDLAGWEKRWFLFEVMLIEPQLMEDASTGFPQRLFEGGSAEKFRFTAGPGAMYDDEDVEAAGQEVWRSRMRVVVSEDRWLITLAQVDTIPAEKRDTFLLNLALISYPFGQYLLQFILDQAIAKDAFVTSGMEYATQDQEWAKWAWEYKHRHVVQRAEVEKLMREKYPGGWARWRVGWGKVDVDVVDRGWGQGETDTGVTRVGVLASRPLPSLSGQTTTEAIPSEENHLRVQLVVFEVETTTLSLLERLHPIGAGDEYHHARLTRLQLLVKLCLILTRSPSPIRARLQDVLVQIRDSIRGISQKMGQLELRWLELDAAFAWDMKEVWSGLQAVGLDVGAEGLLP